MNDYREVGDLSVRVMLFPKEEGNPIPAITAGRSLSPDSSPPSRMGFPCGALSLRHALLRVRDAMGLIRLPVRNTSGLESAFGPEISCLSALTLQKRNRLRSPILGQALALRRQPRFACNH